MSQQTDLLSSGWIKPQTQRPQILFTVYLYGFDLDAEMTVSINSFLGFNSKAAYKHVFSSSIGGSAPKPIELHGFSSHVEQKRFGYCLSVVDNKRVLDRIVTSSSSKKSGETDWSSSDNQAVNAPAAAFDYLERNSQVQTNVNDESGSQTSESSNGSVVPAKPKQAVSSSSEPQSRAIKAPLTARERLKAARVLSRYAESKPSKSEMGSKVLDALRESDKGKKKSRLPEAPTNLFDDSKRGMPKPGLTFQFPGGNDLFIIVFSFVFISTVMFATTFLVWKVGAIHFNEY